MKYIEVTCYHSGNMILLNSSKIKYIQQEEKSLKILIGHKGESFVVRAKESYEHIKEQLNK